jgi:hypothetical protein
MNTSVFNDKMIQSVQTKDSLCFTKFAKCTNKGSTLIIRNTGEHLSLVINLLY